MAEAAPGSEPQIAVEPGKTRVLVRAQPNRALTTSTDSAAAMNKGQSCTISCRIAGVIFCAIMPPIAACAMMKSLGETCARPSKPETIPPAAMAPRSSPAGRRAAVSAPPKSRVNPISAPH